MLKFIGYAILFFVAVVLVIGDGKKLFRVYRKESVRFVVLNSETAKELYDGDDFNTALMFLYEGVLNER